MFHIPSVRGRRHSLALATVLALVLSAVAYWALSARRTGAPAVALAPSLTTTQPAAAEASGPPWTLGRASARFTVVAYADFECPYCQSYLPHLMRWAGETQDVALQWHHLPLPDHEPQASQAAHLAECLGEAGGAAAFWQAVTWIYQHTRGNGQGVPPDTKSVWMTPAVQACLASERPQAIVRTQAEEAAAAGIHATPTVQILDSATGQTLTLSGPAEDDVLLSGLDWLASTERSQPPVPAMPADEVGDMPK